MDNPTQSVHDDPSAPLFCQLFELILNPHMLCVESALLVLEELRVHRHQLAKGIGLHLVYEVVYGITVHKAPLLRVVGVQVKVEVESFVGV